MKRASRHSAGFTLLELLVSIAIFLVVGGVALALVAKSIPLYNRQQGMTALNIGLRSAVTQIEQDAVNAGTGYYVGGTYPDWPVGVSIAKAPAGTCYNAVTHAYSASCFDTLNVITTDLTTPFGVLGGVAGTNILSSATTLTVNVPASINPATGLAWTATNYAAQFPSGSQILLLTGGTSNNKYTTFKLTLNAAVGAGIITLTHTATNADSASLTGGTNGGAGAGHINPGPPVVIDVPCTATAAPANDDLGITMCANDKLTATFQAGNAWVFKLATVTYWVDVSNATNPKLERRAGPAAAASDVVAEQIIGFKIGVGLWNNGNGVDDYKFDPAQYPNMSSNPYDGGLDPYNYTRVRSLRVSLIGRTTPSTDPTNSFRNTFDGGRYQIQAASVVVNPRNLSMRDN